MSLKGLVLVSTQVRIRGINSKIRDGEVRTESYVVPFLKKFESTVRCCTQNASEVDQLRSTFQSGHQEIEDILVLKNNKGTEDNRVRKLDYSIQISKLFYERFIEDKEITLFSPHSCPNLFESFVTLTLMSYIAVTNWMNQSPKRKVRAKN